MNQVKQLARACIYWFVLASNLLADGGPLDIFIKKGEDLVGERKAYLQYLYSNNTGGGQFLVTYCVKDNLVHYHMKSQKDSPFEHEEGYAFNGNEAFHFGKTSGFCIDRSIEKKVSGPVPFVENVLLDVFRFLAPGSFEYPYSERLTEDEIRSRENWINRIKEATLIGGDMLNGVEVVKLKMAGGNRGLFLLKPYYFEVWLSKSDFYPIKSIIQFTNNEGKPLDNGSIETVVNRLSTKKNPELITQTIELGERKIVRNYKLQTESEIPKDFKFNFDPTSLGFESYFDLRLKRLISIAPANESE